MNRRSEWARRYGPLPGLVVALVLVAAVLPSSLNLPQSNPTTTPEFAPVPPSDDKNPPPDTSGNFAGVGLTSTGGQGGGGTPPPPPPGALPGVPPPPPVQGKTPQTKLCVGNPPRQTEDPLSPPCVGYFKGDNGGATYQGVTPTEIRVLVVAQGNRNQGSTSRSGGTGERHPNKVYIDADEPIQDDDPIFTRTFKLWQRYFNERYQTYNRRVKITIWYGGGTLPEDRRAEAEENFQKIKPFAVYDSTYLYTQDYAEVMASKGVMVFGPTGFHSAPGFTEDFYKRFPGLLWTYNPSVENRAHNFATYVCRQVVPFPASFSGNAGENGQPRRLGMLWHDFDEKPEFRVYAEVVRKGVKACGGNIVVEGKFPYSCQDQGCPGQNPNTATQNMTTFQREGVSTIIWAGGGDAQSGKAAGPISYKPEIIVGGDLANETTLSGQYQDQEFWSRAFAVTTYTRVSPFESSPCYQAATYTDPNANRQDTRNFACYSYDGLRQLFTGIQVAGPRLTPKSMEEGYRAIPSVRSDDPRIPACFYEPRDFTCVKDATVQWWDPSGRDPESTQPGCWRLIQGGRRYLPGTWPEEDVLTRRKPDDPCNPEGLTS